MSFKTAKNKIIEIIEGIEPTETDLSAGDNFIYADFAIDSQHIQTRRFSYTVSMTTTRGSDCGRRSRAAVMTVYVGYRDETNSDHLHELIMSDYKDITEALINVYDWDAENSTLEILSVGGNDIFEAEINFDYEHGAFLIFNFPMRYYD